jgi:peptidyl-prolyl cis-trans isomerase C
MTAKTLVTTTMAAALVVSAAACRKAPAPAANSTSTPAATGAPQLAAGQPAAGQPATPQPPKPMPAQLPDVLARVNGEAVKRVDFDLFIKNLELAQGPIPTERRDEVLRGVLDRIITFTVLEQEAKTRNIGVTDPEVDARIAEMKQPYPNDETFQKALAARNMTLDRLRNDTRNGMIVDKLLQGEVGGVPGASDNEAKDFYAKNPDKFSQGESVRASHILVKVDEKADPATKKKARAKIDSVLKRAKAGEDFATLAKANSDDGSAQQGGDLNYFTRGQMVPAFEQAAFTLKPGQVSDVVTTQFGYHIIKVTDHKAAGKVPFEQVNDRVKQFLTEQKKQQKADEFIAGLKQKSKIEVLV